MAFNELEVFGPAEFVRRRRAPDALWGFVHIPKTAGTSLVNALRRSFDPIYAIRPTTPQGADAAPETNQWDSIRDFVLRQSHMPHERRYRMFTGHLESVRVDFITQAFPESRLFTIIRDPVERLISNYRYSLSTSYPHRELFANTYPSFEHYISLPGSQNTMAKYLLGHGRNITENNLGEVFEKFDFVGSLGRYRESLHMLGSLLGIGEISLDRLNVTANAPNSEIEIGPGLRAELLKLNHLDVALYDRVNDALEAGAGSNGAASEAFDAPERAPKRAWGTAAEPRPANRAGSTVTNPDRPRVGPLFILGPAKSGRSAILRLCEDVLGYGTGSEVIARLMASVDSTGPTEKPHMGPGPVVVDLGEEPAASLPEIKRNSPEARFIFVKERGIECVGAQLSRGRSFEEACVQWARSMENWLAVRKVLEPNFIEVDQRTLDCYPVKVAQSIFQYLGFGSAVEIANFLYSRSAKMTAPVDGGGYVSLDDTGWDAVRKRRFSDICGEVMIAAGYDQQGDPGALGPNGELDLVAPPVCGLWRVSNGNPWTAPQWRGMLLHPNKPDPGAPPATVRLAGALGPGRYRFDGEVRIFDARCPRHRLVMSMAADGLTECGQLVVDGSRVGEVEWGIPLIDVAERSDLVIEIILDESSATHQFGATRLLSAKFAPL